MNYNRGFQLDNYKAIRHVHKDLHKANVDGIDDERFLQAVKAMQETYQQGAPVIYTVMGEPLSEA